MPDKNILIFGDTHFRCEEPYFSASTAFMDWAVEQPFNTKHNYAIFLGDVFHRAKPHPKTITQVIKFFSRLEFSNIYILSGNYAHEYDSAHKSHAINVLSEMENVTIITTPQEVTIGQHALLLLPWYHDNFVDDLPMKDKYEQMSTSDTGNTFLLTAGHFFNTPMFGEEINLSVDSKYVFMGHYHTPANQNQAKTNMYVGSVMPTSRGDCGYNGRIISLNTDTERYDELEIPRFIDFATVKYGDSPPVSEHTIVITVTGAPSLDAAREKYKECCIGKITLSKFSEEEEESQTQQDIIHMPILEAFEAFCNTKLLSSDAFKKKVLHYLGGGDD